MHDPAGRDAVILKEALTPDFINLGAVTEIICSRTSSQVQNLKQIYYSTFSSYLEHDIEQQATGDHQKILLACINKPRYEGMEVDREMAAKDAKALYKAGEKKLGTDEKVFVQIFSERSRAHLVALNTCYHDMYGGSLKKAIKSETSGLFERALLTILQCAENPVKYFAKYNFEGRYDLVRFLKIVQKAGMYVHLRVGPYVCAEWNFGGFPVWLKYVPGISFRTDNEPFKRAMKGFTEKIVNLMKSEKMFESQGGPIILSQVENEYGSVGKTYGGDGHSYMTWAANMAVGLGTGVPWVMCKQDDAPDPIINTCNGFYCDEFSPNKPYKPTLWTEAWSGWFTEFGGPVYQRPVQDLAFGVARFIQKGGSFFNYYMYHGGTNFGRSSGGPFITTSYDYDAPIDEYGLIRQPKYDHLKELHKAIKQCEPALVSADPVVTSLGSLQQAHVYSPITLPCAAFLSNYDPNNAAKVIFNNKHYNLPPWSISILPDCKNVAFNTAQVGVQSTQIEMLASDAKMFSWETYTEDLTVSDESSMFTATGLLEQINITRDTSDYLWYTTSVDIGSSESFLRGGELPKLLVQSSGHALHVFINGEHSGSVFGSRKHRKVSYKENINLRAGSNKIALLSVAMGLPNMGGHYEAWETGVLGPVALYGLDQGKRDLSWVSWTYQVGLRGEAMNVISSNPTSSIKWTQDILMSQKQQPLTWHKAYFNAPDGDEPLALDMNSMGKGEAWVNGQSIGRYWTTYANGDCQGCHYAGTYRPLTCQLGCGQPTQRWYHVPRSWIKPTNNLLVLFEELGGDPTRVSIVKRSMVQ